jgi:SAM-dependent methyltransferase
MPDPRAAALCALSKCLRRPPAQRTVDYSAYSDWRMQSLSASWSHFDDRHVLDKDVLDFGCGDGALSLFLAQHKAPRRVVGVDLNGEAIMRATKAAAALPADLDVRFLTGSTDGLPVPDRSVDTLVAFDCMEHVMEPAPILREWHRVLRPGGRALIEWFPFKGPWGPHMESLIPVPWAHYLFGQRAMMEAAASIYDSPDFVPRHWDLDEHGHKKPNKWRQWSTFKEQGYVNELDLAGFKRLARDAGMAIDRLDTHSFGGSAARRHIGRALMGLPLVGEFFVSFAAIELVRV